MNNQEELILHLTELRKRLIVFTSWFIAMLCVGVYLSPRLLVLLKSRPAKLGIQWNVFAFTDGLFVYMKCALLFAVLLSLPVLFYQLWAFVRPGLTEVEALAALAYVPASFLMFLLGVAFSYYLVFPMMLEFLMQMNRSIGAAEIYGIDRYFTLMFNIVFPLGIAFEMPVVVLFLTRLELMTPDKLRRIRKPAYLGLTIVGACISPPDVVSHLSVTIPLIALFELSICLSAAYSRRLDASSASP
ncbi:twin-arginine translocase subunit TatC [Paenibacillus thiaminolyticus]|uniref:Sec-independent protein translocase protein TatC n=1 Tax=Paenibacillus thiaminolyticus TaxID=49283 RepID=A0AAP9J1B7_PANTH|nr:twin-arginine translocase subunit TatC [Paenibacillus thiaminolyticus]MCY9535623.1 twin-arginine translocase subunit TatC [Paenibacillus thiaminolyticus]MCY9600337.1 twin-arginine translocase subunit TatC [Paenibacillus thiaminolyticus]MCY9607333.1 twin-arginine translocase subunit TatC [Paenibacillus thiaminolyticus]MCY9613924.1 twin-arginine translocase subunit TatC [Paenibacillus thiaminolyticus]MCY9617929.1 twin-arginine translocase subunit TatC [Paenibacillus thiaminolyticus]